MKKEVKASEFLNTLEFALLMIRMKGSQPATIMKLIQDLNEFIEEYEIVEG